MDPIFGIDFEAFVSPYGEKYTNEIEFLTQMIDICLLEGSFRNNQNKEMIISSLKKRIIINCNTENYQCVIDDIEILQRFVKNIYMDNELRLALTKAINDLEKAQKKYDKELFERLNEKQNDLLDI